MKNKRNRYENIDEEKLSFKEHEKIKIAGGWYNNWAILSKYDSQLDKSTYILFVGEERNIPVILILTGEVYPI